MFELYSHGRLPPLSPEVLRWRRDVVFVVLAGLFLGTLTMLNILGISRFILLASVGQTDEGWIFALGRQVDAVNPWVFAVAVGVLPYPITFLCTDLISELYGRRRASLVVWVGLLLNVWVIFIMWLGGAMPGFEAIDPHTGAVALDEAGRLPVFFEVRTLTFGAVTASMVAYLAAQLCDVHVFHFWKWLTNGKHLWLRNCGSTFVSQMVDTVAVILITHYYAKALPINEGQSVGLQLLTYIATGYTFKFLCAVADTGPFYLGTIYLSRYLRVDPVTEEQE